MEKRTKILCVGIGGYAQNYLRELLAEKDPDFEIVGMVDIAPQASAYYETLCQRGAKLYDSMEAFYAEQTADLAILTTPIHLHTRQILCALRHGSDVMCEKPMCGESKDEALILEAMKTYGGFVSIGYQWSFSDAILNLKRDILKGVYGKPISFKTMALWPRPESYFRRGSGWGGKIHAEDGSIINDSVLNNATAHFMHNMLFLCGEEMDRSCDVELVQGDLMRTNQIENFDTAVVKMHLKNGADCLCVVSHSTKDQKDPVFLLRFEGGVVRYDNAEGDIVGQTDSGVVYHYGNPFRDINRKIREAIRHAGDRAYRPSCGVVAAACQVRGIEMVQRLPIRDTLPESVEMQGGFRYVKGLDALLRRCYEQEYLLRDDPDYCGMIAEAHS